MLSGSIVVQPDHLIVIQAGPGARFCPDIEVFTGNEQESGAAVTNHQSQGLAAGHTGKRYHATTRHQGSQIEGHHFPAVFRQGRNAVAFFKAGLSQPVGNAVDLMQQAGPAECSLFVDDRGLVALSAGKGLNSKTDGLHGFAGVSGSVRSEEHTSELQSRPHLVCRLLLEKKNTTASTYTSSRL